tara:strand:- start:22 stop:690 length:669 start_codon:yes stop_codon:yes gene_type:complete
MDFGNPMIKKIMLALWVSTLSTNALSTTFYLGHLSHPSTAKYAEFFTAVYTDLNIDLRFGTLPAERQFLSLEKGDFDGIFVAGSHQAQRKGVLKIDWPIAHVKLFLYCNISPCNHDVLLDPSNMMHTTRGYVGLLENEFGIIPSAQIKPNELYKTLEKLMKIGELDYLLLGEIESLPLQGYDKVEIGYYALYHLINEKHEALIPAIKASMKKHMGGSRDFPL